MNLTGHPCTHPDDYWDVNEAGKIALGEAEITMPFPQKGVHIKQEA